MTNSYLFRSRSDGAYPLSIDDVRHRSTAVFGDVATADILDAADVDQVETVAPPQFDPQTQTISEGEPESVGGHWRQTWVVEELPALPPMGDRAVTAERDRRMDAGISFAGNRFQSRPLDRENIAGASQLAFMAIIAEGAQPGNLRWASADRDFVWIAEDNTLVPMDAHTVIAFAKTAAAYKEALTMTARGIKNMDPIPADFADDALWPAQ